MMKAKEELMKKIEKKLMENGIICSFPPGLFDNQKYVPFLQNFFNEINSKTDHIDIKMLLKTASKQKFKSLFWFLFIQRTNGIVSNIDSAVEYLELMEENIRKEDGNSLLHYAAKGIFLHEYDVQPLLLKIEIGKFTPMQIIEAIVKKAETNEEKKKVITDKNDFGFTPLRCAIEHRHGEAVEYLAKCYKTLNVKRDSWSLVHFAAKIDIEGVKPLLANEWNVDELDGEGRTLLHITSEKAFNPRVKETLELLLDSGANFNKKSGSGYTPLMVAVSCDQLETVKLFIKKNNPCIFFSHGQRSTFEDKSIMIIAVQHDAIKFIKYFLSESFHEEVADFLIHENDDDHPQTSHQANTNNNLEIFKKADCLIHSILYDSDKNGDYPIHIVAQTGTMAIFMPMIELYHTALYENLQLQTPLHIAAAKGHDEIFRQLLLKGCLINSKNINDETPFFLACINNSNGIIEYVMKNIDLTGSIDCRRKYLNIAIESQSVFLLKLVFDKYDSFVTAKKLSIINADNQACFKKAIETGFEEGINYLLNSPHRENILYSPELEPEPFSTPRKALSVLLLIQYMPNVLMENEVLLRDIYSRKMCLEKAIKYQNMLLLKYVFDKYQSEASPDDKLTINHDNLFYFQKAIETGFEKGVYYLLNSKDIEIFLRRQSDDNEKSSMQLLIEHMPKMAGLVFDKCRFKKDKEILINFEFLDDVYYPAFKNQRKNSFFCLKFFERIRSLYPRNNRMGDEEQHPLNNIESRPTHTNHDSAKQAKNYCETITDHPLSLIVKYSNNDLLFHPLVELYIDTKWNRFAKWGYYTLCFIHFLIVTFLTLALFDAKQILLLNDDEENVNKTVINDFLLRVSLLLDEEGKENKTVLNNFLMQVNLLMDEEEKINDTLSKDILMPKFHGWFLVFIGIIHGVLFYLKYGREFEFISHCYVVFVIILTGVIGICYIFTTYVPGFFLIILNLCAWINLLYYLKKHPRLGVYVLMIQHIVTSFLRFAPIFLMFLLPFVIMFYVFFSRESSASIFFKTFIQTLVMMIGEFDYAGSIATKANFITSIVFCLFLFLVTIFLMNLLVALAVSDTSKILEKVAFTKRIMQIETIHHVEISMPEFIRRNLWEDFCKNPIKLKDLEKRKHYFTSTKFREHFKWFGLPKSAIKDEISKDEPSEYIIRMENKINELECKMEEIKNLIINSK